jgi:hypothetical protein
MQQVAADPGLAGCQAMGAAAQAQQAHRGRGAVAAAPELAAITHQAEICGETAVAAAALLAFANQQAG